MILFSIYLVYYQFRGLYLIISGPLQGKFALKRLVHQSWLYLKKCSSIIGYSYVSTIRDEIMFAEKFDMNTLISPDGGWEVFKKSATTYCKGREYIF